MKFYGRGNFFHTEDIGHLAAIKRNKINGIYTYSISDAIGVEKKMGFMTITLLPISTLQLHLFQKVKLIQKNVDSWKPIRTGNAAICCGVR